MQDKAKGEGVRCKSFNITEDLGQVEHVLCDKFGTLNKMSFRSCFVVGRDFKHDTDGIGGVLLNTFLNAELGSELKREYLSRLLKSRVLICLLTLALANTVSIAASQVEETEESSSSNFEAESGSQAMSWPWCK